MSLIDTLGKIPLDKFPGFIRYIRFPSYKGIALGSKVTFSYPFTAIVGPNGCGKTSILHALYGCPYRKSTSEFWFSTPLDPIEINSDSKVDRRPRYIYSYKPEGCNQEVEVIKQWITRKGNPDYWEPYKIKVTDGMMPIGGNILKCKGLRAYASNSLDRWDPVKRDVLYVSFKSELSAFDKFMNYGDFSYGKNIKSKQDFIRFRTEKLVNALEKDDGYTWHARKIINKSRCNQKTLDICSYILGKEYKEATFIEHDFFNNVGSSVIFSEKNNGYSEALAGSGEVAVFSLVEKVVKCEPGTLILLDEPEVSLHPGAQKNLEIFCSMK
jgi:ABC-type cobalamin/Fe3+-siderophores transport systems, ATPase components